MLFEAFEAKWPLVTGPILRYPKTVWECKETTEDFGVTLEVELGHFEEAIFYLFKSYTHTVNQKKLADQKHDVLVIE